MATRRTDAALQQNGESCRPRWCALALILALVGLVTAFGACGGDDNSGGGGGGNQKVSVGLGPYYDYSLFAVAAELGLDKEIGVDLDIQYFPDIPRAQLLRGGIDVGFSSPSAAFAIYNEFPTYREFMLGGQFKGFALIGRPGEITPYDDYLKKAGDDAKVAKREFVSNELKGKSICMVRDVHLAILSGMLALGGLKVDDDVTITDFSDEANAANAFVRKQCDLYTGALPQEVRLLLSPEFKGQFIEAAPHEAFGAGEEGAVEISTFAATQEWFGQNRDTAKKLWAIWYRAVRYLKEKPDVATPIIADAIRVAADVDFDPQTTQKVYEQFIVEPTLEEAKARFFDPKSPSYYWGAVKEQFSSAVKEGVVDEGTELAPFHPLRQLFPELLADKKLISYINKPLKEQ